MNYYINMDHAGWVERNIAAAKRVTPNASERRKMAERKGWFAAPDQLNPFQRRAFDILGIVGNGIYNAPISWKTVYWDERVIAVSWRNSLATFDFSQLTRFVFLCHEARIRGDISPKDFRHVEIMMSERVHEGRGTQSHPDLAEALQAFRIEFQSGHSVFYQKPQTDAA